MKINKRQAKTLNEAITQWEKDERINADTAKSLRNSYVVVGFDWKLLAVYSFWIAITCFVISIGVLLADDYLMALLATLIDTPASVLSVISAVLAAGSFTFGVKRRRRYPEKYFSNEAMYFFGVLWTAVSVGFLRETAWFTETHVAFFLLALTLIYGVIGFRLSSMLVWIFALLSFAAWGLEQTSYFAEPSAYFLGLNMAWRLVVIGLLVLATAWWFGRQKMAGATISANQGSSTTPPHKFAYLQEPTRFIGLFYLMFALWLVSLVGNHTNAATWSKVSQVSFLPWALLSGLVCLGLLYHGIKHADKLTRSFGIIFLLINLYTRYFEYFWDAMHKTVFFALLALSFWLIGTKAEKLWQLSHIKENEEA
ncbi:hypothetical protein PTW35_19155 (plasmid) [Photobacterium sp. DA100]|uniref:hypothetical protein n=1 Tax=Photobacterium sp. DA100 TaxID=3027472 RepID=UPI00247A9B45|nr:hypothetical protein [Photobacterium sp. DA100]WEM45208.1 hypothetical protein PTW35_19155 [Photobacterium sp. DA100]